MKIGHVEVSNLQGIADKAIGLLEELFGTLTGRDALVTAGRQRQDAATERLKALQLQLEAEKEEAKAKANAAAQKTAQAAKERNARLEKAS